jgi:hypothetical protein
MDRLARVRRTAIVLASTVALWAPLVVLTGGFGFRIGSLSISSRRPHNAVVIALVLAAAAWLIAPAGQRTAAIRTDVAWLAGLLRTRTRAAWLGWRRRETALIARASSRAAAGAALVVAVVIIAVGFREGAHVAAASDAWGYVSEADLWARGNLRVEQPLMRELTREIPAEALAPLAYRPSIDRTTIVPVVAPGLPMLMALFQIGGGRDAVFVVVPLMAGLAVWAAALIGTRLAGPWIGVATAILLATSPSFLFQLTSSPMSDIPAAAWWAVSLGALLGNGRGAPLVSGLAAGAAILTRPNLAPLAAIPAAHLLLNAWRSTFALRASVERRRRRDGITRLVLFLAGVIPAGLVTAWVNTYWYGSPLASGYGALDEIFAWTHVATNLERYPRWLLESQTPLVLLAFAAPWIVPRRSDAWRLIGFVGGVLACYLAYVPFDAWWFLRFLLPGFPPLLALTAAAIAGLAVRLPAGLCVAAAAAAVGGAAWHGVTYAEAHATFTSEGERKYAVAGEYVAEHLPQQAVLLAIQHSGSARYYSGRVTIRWDWVPPDKLQWMLGELRRLGHAPYALIEDWEVRAIRERFPGHPALGRFDRPPLVELPLGHVRIYDLD